MLLRHALILGGSIVLSASLPAFGAQPLTLVYSFKGKDDGEQPHIPLVAGNGLLYGATSIRGTDNEGTIFSFDPATDVETPIATGAAIGGELGSAMLFYAGTLYGVVTTKHAKNGEIFSLDPSTGAVTVLYTFKGGADGQNPQGPLIVQGGVLYGVTLQGGAGGDGTVFGFNLTGNVKTTLYSFTGQADGTYPVGPVAYSKGTLYGATEGSGSGNPSIFAVDAISGAETTLYTFAPIAGTAQAIRNGVIIDGTTLYGTTYQSGDGMDQLGSVYSFDVASGTETDLHFFQNQPDGERPEGPLALAGHDVYGATFNGGKTFGGVIFKVTVPKGKYKILADPKGEVEPTPVTPLNGVLYGAQIGGGMHKDGAIFALPK